LTLGLAIAAARLIPAADRSQREGVGSFREMHAFAEFYGKTALVVGWGAVGSTVGRMLRDGLGMSVLVHSPRAANIEDFERASSFVDGLSRADLISLHTPLRPETRGLLGGNALSAAKSGAILVNTARGGLVDEMALARAVQTGRIAAAALDDYSEGAPNGPLAETARVIFTPHLGGTTNEALRRVALAAAQIVISALAGKRPEGALNAQLVLAP
jgi:D-3-phosphoglycerate dehydrogenase / 2-oxoglutarate reductase